MQGGLRSILCVHPNGELYGSDRVFLQAVRAFNARWPDAAITVALPSDGELAREVRRLVDDVRIVPMSVLRRAHPLATAASLLRLPRAVYRAYALMRGYDLVYVSTVIALDHLLATRFVASAVLIHVHELPTGRTQVLIGGLLRFSRGFLVLISMAVRDAFQAQASRSGAVIWNGTRPIVSVTRAAPDVLHILLIGRFNAWKGQRLLIEAVARLSPTQRRRLMVRLVGSAFTGQEHLKQLAANLVVERELEDCIEICGFDPNPGSFFAWADIVVVPSTRPEPFGLVAIEAMSAGCATIAADHGGLSEIVVDGQTGLLVPPGEADRLAAALVVYLDNPGLARTHGAAGRLRFEMAFREEQFMERLADIAEKEVIPDPREADSRRGFPNRV